jgi:hypothetical protein
LNVMGYHGSPNKITDTLRASDRGNFGPGAYLTAQPQNAKSYGSNVFSYRVPDNLFSTTDKLTPDIEKSIVSNLTADQASKLATFKGWYGNDGGAFWEALRRSAGGDQAASKAIQDAGYAGIQGLGDGHEIAVFNPSHLVRTPEHDPAQPVQPVPPSITAYHGSPHSFDQFDLSKIGTGEGAQAYGHEPAQASGITLTPVEGDPFAP